LTQTGNKISKALRLLLEEHKLTTTELARRTGLVQPVVYRMISGETINPKIETLIPLARYFKITVDQLIGQSALASTHTKTSNRVIKLPIISWQEAIDWPDVPLQEKVTSYCHTNTTVSETAFALTIKNSTMAPSFPEKSLIVVDNETPLKNKDFAIIHLKKRKEAIFRQVLFDGEDLYLKSLNPDFKVIHLHKSDDYRCLGVVLEVVVNTKDIEK